MFDWILFNWNNDFERTDTYKDEPNNTDRDFEGRLFEGINPLKTFFFCLWTGFAEIWWAWLKPKIKNISFMYFFRAFIICVNFKFVTFLIHFP